MRALAGPLTYTASPPVRRAGEGAVPELLEIETLRRDLEKEIVGRKIADVEVMAARTVRRHRNRGELGRRLVPHRIAAVDRHGAHLLLSLDSGDALVAALGATGRLRR